METDARQQTVRIEPGSPARAVLRLPRLVLRVVTGGGAGPSEAPLDRELLLGRDRACDLRFAAPSVSGRHATVAPSADGPWLEDLGSTNGTTVNGVPVQRARVQAGDRVRLGEADLDVVAVAEPELVLAEAATALGEMVGSSERMRLLFGLVRRLAPTDLAILARGETGSGKELLARAVHDLSRRSSGPFVAVDAASLGETLAASELFGHEKGAFTGAERQHKGAFERADGGTLFLDEVGELRPEVQSHLLRVLETGTFNRVGGEAPVRVDVRVVAATHRDLEAMADEGSFRRDLMFRLAQATLVIPPLRERLEDLPLLIEHLLGRARQGAAKPGRHVPLRLAPDALEALRRHSWPGNVRELRNVVAQLVVLCPGPEVRAAELPPLSARPGAAAAEPALAGRAFGEVKLEMIRAALGRAGGNKSKAARELGVAVSTFSDWCKRLGL